MRLEPIVKFPAEPTVLSDREDLEWHVLEKGRERGLEGNPEGVVRTDENTNDGDLKSRSSAIVDQQAVSIVEAADYRNKSQQ